MRRLAEEHRGLVLVTGGTGSGKTTTLAAVINHINRTRQQHIVTIEDPIEILHEDVNCIVNQREVGLDTASFHEALRRALRQDPDVILIGELRDADTAQTALHAAESGHLVLSTMHTVDASETVGRMVEFFPGSKQPLVRSVLAGVLRGVVTQRLLPKVDGGRVAAVEVMVNNARVSDLIRDNRADEIHDAIADGSFFDMQTFSHALIELVVVGAGRPRRGGERRDEPARLPRRRRACSQDRRGREARRRAEGRGAGRSRAPPRSTGRLTPVRAQPRGRGCRCRAGMASRLKRIRTSLARQDGYSMVEFLVVMVILSIVVGSITTVFVSASKAELDMNRRFQAQQQARLSVDKLRREIHCATAVSPSGIVVVDHAHDPGAVPDRGRIHNGSLVRARASGSRGRPLRALSLDGRDVHDRERRDVGRLPAIRDDLHVQGSVVAEPRQPRSCAAGQHQARHQRRVRHERHDRAAELDTRLHLGLAVAALLARAKARAASAR